jgi:hypothetical protein
MNQRRTSQKSTVPRSFALFLAKGRESTTLNMPHSFAFFANEWEAVR